MINDYGTPNALGTQQIPRYVYGSTIIDLPVGETFSSNPVKAGNQSVEVSKGGQAVVAVWSDTELLEYDPIYQPVPHEYKLLLDAFFSSAGVNFMEQNFTYYPNANNPSESYDMRLASPGGYEATEIKSGGTRRLWIIAVSMRREVN